ncbi:MAG: helix-turn-helix transcriptional regulator [Oscillospiraceae bacterium]|nr:helix-turn-helix transcriptional regulator [Oscillospiraceae bacterium]
MPKHISKQRDTQYGVDYKKDIAEFGRRVRARREELNISLDELANRINGDKSSLSLIENGERVPRLDRVLQIADALHTTPAKLCPNRFLNDGSADLLPQIYNRLQKQSVEQRRTSLRYICAMLDGLALTEDGSQ